MNLNELERTLTLGKLTCNGLKQFLLRYADVAILPTEESHFLVFYCRGMLDSAQLNEFYYPIVTHISSVDEGEHTDLLPPVEYAHHMKQMIHLLFSGSLIIYREGERFFYTFNIGQVPQRKPQESQTEISIKGPKDSFTEEMDVNVSLIRKRMKTAQLCCESFTLGSITATELSLLYLQDKTEQIILDEVRNRIATFEGESVIGSGQLEQWLSDRTFSLFPLLDYVTRPDFAIESLLRGRFIIIVNGSPIVLIGPTNVFHLIKSPEDVHFPFYFVIFGRLLRIIGLLFAIFLPGLWISLSSVNVDQLPFSLLATVAVSREGLPLPIGLEAMFILGLFELLREAGIRIPTFLGQTVSIVGGIIIGDAAIRAGLASPTLIVVIALTAVSSYTLVNQSLVGTVSILRIYTLILAIFLGVYGLFLGGLSIVVYLSVLESFKIAYLEPVASLTFREYLAAFLFNPFKRKRFGIPFLRKVRKHS